MSDTGYQLPAYVQAMPDEEKRLRKEWLKRKFSSFAYHEELVKLHEQWRDVLRAALQRAVHDETPDPDCGLKAEAAKNFERTYWPIIERKPKPGDYKPELWDQYYATGMFRSIPDYNRYLISEGDALSWMSEGEQCALAMPWGKMDVIAANIRQTVDGKWMRKGTDDWILDETLTGPIDWPADWRDELQASASVRAKAGVPAPRGGLWQSVDASKQQIRVKAGELLPNLSSAYGLTIWEFVSET